MESLILGSFFNSIKRDESDDEMISVVLGTITGIDVNEEDEDDEDVEARENEGEFSWLVEMAKFCWVVDVVVGGRWDFFAIFGNECGFDWLSNLSLNDITLVDVFVGGRELFIITVSEDDTDLGEIDADEFVDDDILLTVIICWWGGFTYEWLSNEWIRWLLEPPELELELELDELEVLLDECEDEKDEVGDGFGFKSMILISSNSVFFDIGGGIDGCWLVGEEFCELASTTALAAALAAAAIAADWFKRLISESRFECWRILST